MDDICDFCGNDFPEEYIEYVRCADGYDHPACASCANAVNAEDNRQGTQSDSSSC